MQISTTFRDMPPSPALQAAAERWVARLEQVFDRIVACHVAIEKPHRHHLHGSPFQVNITLTVPGANLAVTNQLNQDATRPRRRAARVREGSLGRPVRRLRREQGVAARAPRDSGGSPRRCSRSGW